MVTLTLAGQSEARRAEVRVWRWRECWNTENKKHFQGTNPRYLTVTETSLLTDRQTAGASDLGETRPGPGLRDTFKGNKC